MSVVIIDKVGILLRMSFTFSSKPLSSELAVHPLDENNPDAGRWRGSDPPERDRGELRRYLL
jgi:hypothetical protein